MKKVIRLGLVLLAVCLGQAFAQSTETGFLDRSTEVDGDSYGYQVYLPRNYSAEEEWPVILFLHGAGERGDDGLKQTQVGLGRAVRLNAERWPAIIIFPQAPTNELWQGKTASAAMSALDATIAEFSADESRVYLTGLSLGGNGSWYLGHQHPERFAAVVAVCGFVQLGDRVASFTGDADNPYGAVAARLSTTPVWIYHGDADVVVPVDESRSMARELRAAGTEVHYTELPGVNHNSWDAAYADDELSTWLFSQSL